MVFIETLKGKGTSNDNDVQHSLKFEKRKNEALTLT